MSVPNRKIFSLTDNKLWAEYFTGVLRDIRKRNETGNVPGSVSIICI